AQEDSLPNAAPMPWRRRALLAGLLGLAAASGLAAGPTRLLETGSTLLYPLFNLWVSAYSAKAPGVQITTQGTGSGTGIAQAVSGLAQIGASDAHMSAAQMRKNPGIMNIPLAISSQTVNYNLPGMADKNLKFSGPVLAGIYSGKITDWDDPALAKLNPGTRLPHKRIIPVHRNDSSGDTFIFTQYLSATNSTWQTSVGYGTTVSWPAVPGGIGAEGNPGMVNALRGNPYAIGYVGISFKSAIAQDKLGEAMLENRSGKFVMATPETVGAAVAAAAAKTPPDERISLITAPGDNSYPIINYEYAIVKRQQRSKAVADALKGFLSWCIDPSGGSAAHFMQAVGFVPLPAAIAALSKKQIDMIH
ncbi:MAG: phosphate ABC transporter substrate-binding protein PstS, partial [Acetobacteraceae bacterium]